MSLVQAVVCDQFVFVAGEQQLNLSSGGVLHNFRKIFKLNDCCFAHKLRKPFTQSAKKKKRLSGPFKTS